MPAVRLRWEAPCDTPLRGAAKQCGAAYNTGMPASLRIAEIFHSLQGEGRCAGTPSVFIRTSGCNLRCWFCDTPYTSWEPEGETRPVKELVQAASAFDC